jgi:hypothetical protein
MNDNEFEILLEQAERGETEAVLSAVDQDRKLATRIGDWEQRLLHRACEKGHVELARGLLARGALVELRDYFGNDATYYASKWCNVDLVTLLLDYGGNPNTTNDFKETAIWAAGSTANLAVCLLLLARGADLMSVFVFVDTASDWYGNYADDTFSDDVLAEHLAVIIVAWQTGPHPSQRWARRWPMISFVTGCRFRPLAGRQGWVHPEGLSLEQRERARRRTLVFSSDVLLRLIVSFL